MCCRQDGGFLAPRYIHPACMPISVPKNDPFYSKHRQLCMNYVRSLMAMRPDCHFGPAEQVSVALSEKLNVKLSWSTPSRQIWEVEL